MVLRSGYRAAYKNGRVWFCTIAIVGVTVGYVGYSKVKQYEPARAPMTIAYVKREWSKGASNETAYTMYYRSDGASVYTKGVTAYPAGGLRSIRIISLPLQKTRMTFDPETKLVYTTILGPGDINIARRRRPARGDSVSACMSELVALLGPGEDRTCERTDDSILGYKVWKTRAQTGPRDRPILFETYLAPALEWRLLRQDSFEAGKLNGRIVATKVSPGEPLESMFRVTKDAKISSVLDFGKAEREIRGLERCSSCELAAKRGSASSFVNRLPPVY